MYDYYITRLDADLLFNWYNKYTVEEKQNTEDEHETHVYEWKKENKNDKLNIKKKLKVKLSVLLQFLFESLFMR